MKYCGPHLLHQLIQVGSGDNFIKLLHLCPQDKQQRLVYSTGILVHPAFCVYVYTVFRVHTVDTCTLSDVHSEPLRYSR